MLVPDEYKTATKKIARDEKHSECGLHVSRFLSAKIPNFISNIWVIFKCTVFLSSFSINLLAFYHECRRLIGYATHVLFCDR